MTDEKKKNAVSMTKAVALAAVLGIAAGAVAVYATGRFEGKQPAIAVAPDAGETAVADTSSCPAADLSVIKQAAIGEVAAMMAQEAPRPLPELTFRGPEGNPVTLADFSGKTLLVNVWATWCAPCREEMPALDTLQAEKGGENFEVVAINVDLADSDDKPKAFLNEIGVDDLALYRAPSMSVFDELKSEGLAFGLPVTLLVGEDGCLLAAMNGPADWASDDAKELIDAAIGV